MDDLARLAGKWGIDTVERMERYRRLFEEHGIPADGLAVDSAPPDAEAPVARRILNVSTHGYWGDPPPAGVPDTGGQTHYVLEISKAWARQGRRVIILARWFKGFPRVERIADGVWLVRVRAGGDAFVRKEEIFGLAPEMAEEGVAVAGLFAADGVIGHYADGMVVATEMAERLSLPLICVPHSLGVLKMMRLGMDPDDQADLRDARYHFWMRESFELAALEAVNFEIANTPREPEILQEVYDRTYPHEVMPAGAARPFFDVAERPIDRALLGRIGLTERRYLLFWGRMSQAKNVAGVVRVLGEARKIAPAETDDVVAVIVGGSPYNPSQEERQIEEQIRREMLGFGLGGNDVVRLESQTHDQLAPLARAGLAYVGMQHLEPFGMGAAEAMGAGLPTLISSAAGITRWLKDGDEALFVDPDDAAGAARKLVGLLKDPAAWERLAERGRRKALDDFSWPGIATRIGRVFDRLHAGEDPRHATGGQQTAERFTRRTGRAYHRLSPAWRGDIPRIEPHHVDAATALLPETATRIRRAHDEGRRLTVGLGGESGSGKTEIAHLLALMLRREGLNGIVLAGDAFFVRPPAENHRYRVEADGRGALEEAIGPDEVDLARLDRILAAARERATARVEVPSDCRRLPGRRYPDVPVSLEGIDALFIDLTYALLLENLGWKVFLERGCLTQLDSVEERNRERDPDQDFAFVRRVLEIEHAIIAPLRSRADIVVDADYRIVQDA
jgi:glycosyltransferase involved in cell wall biosynthesis